MKKLLFSVAAVLITSTVNAQKQTNEIQAVSIPVSYNGLTGSLINYLEPVGTVNEITKTPKIGYHPKGDWILNESVNPNALPQGEDPALQKHYSPANTNVLTQSWDGITNFNTNPADPAVDVGPNHVVQMTNGPSGAYIQVYSKTGGAIGSQIYFDNFMNMPGGLGDPIVLYDERADRWMLSEFSSSGDNMHIAISQTADPTGAYYTFSFNSPNFPDYPKYSIWNDAYIITTNESGNSPVYAINRADLLSGTPTSAQRFTVPSYGTIGFQATTPVSLLGTTNPPAGAPPMVMRMRDDAWSGVANDALEIWEINLDWSNSSNSSINQITTLNMTLPFDSELCGYTSFSCIDQPGSNTNLDPLREVLMNRIMYRNFSTHESIVCCHVTDVSGNDQAGIRWYELRRTGGAAGSWILYQESTYAPDTDSRWMPSIGISASGNIGLAYNVSSSSTYPSLRYTGRKECDPLDQMTEPETSIATGTTNNNSNRYGDYNSMGVDPSDGETFYFTGVYNPTSSGSTRIGAFNIELCNQDPAVQFDIATAIVNETDATTASSSCLDYQVINVPISIGLSPTQNADITVLVTGGSATLGEDFTLNNSTFTLAGSVLTATAEVWVYNDNIVEGTENIILGYTLNANGGDAVSAIANQLVDITINDNDLDPTSIVNDATLLTENFESGFGGFTTINASGDTPFQIGDATNASTQPMTFPATNTSNFVWINDDNCDCDQDNVDLNFPPINLTGFTSGTLSFLSYFEGKTWDNNTETAEIYVSIDGGAATLVQPITTDVVWMTQNVDLSPYTGNNNVVFSIKYSDGTGYLYGMGVDDVSIISQGPIGIQTDMNSSAGMTANLAPNTTVYFYDTTSTNVMLSLENTSSFDYGCVTVEVDRDGTSALQFNTANPNDFLHSKTFKVTPTNSNPNGTYNVTLYYKESEVAGWESITGNSRNDAEIIKVDGSNAINDVNPSNANSFSISSSASVLGSFYSDVTFTGVFSSGFSGLGVGVYNAVAQPAVQFDIATAIVNETDATTASSSCLDYQVINVPISIGLSPTQNADITVLVTGGSATLGEDFTLNNSTFTLAGSVLTATAEVWVYNDNIVEGTENIILGYTLNANGGDAVSAIANQLVDITINDNDLDPTSIVNDATLLTENFESGFGGFTTINASGDTPFQIGDATNASTQPMTFPATNTSNFVWINDDNCDCDQDNVDLNFPPINLTGFTSGTLSFLSYFEGKTWDNNTETAEIYVSIDGGAATLVQPITTDVVWMTQNVDLSPYTGNNNVVFSIKYSDGTGYLYGMGVDDVSIISQGPIGIQTDMNSSAGMTANLAPNTTVYFYDTTSTNVMLSLENTSSFDYGCVTVEVDRDGTSALQFNTANPNDFLHSKTFKVTPTNSNPNGTYNVTLYYKESEVAGWESITGNSRNDAEIIKVDGSNAINDVNPSNANSFSISSSASVLGSFYSDVTFTGVFSSGFSGLGVGVYNSTGPVAPTANFTSNTSSTCEGNEINFTDLSGGGPTSWMWTFGDGNSSTSQNPTHIYNAAGIYNVTLTASNSEGSDVSTQTSMITVLNEIASSQAFEICDGSSIDIGTSTYNSAGVYIDTIPNLNGCDSIITTNLSILSSSSLSLSYTICQGSSLTVGNNTYSNAGTYTEIYSNNLGCDSIVNTTIIFNPSPIVSTSPNSIGPLCSYETSVTMVGIPSGGVFSGVGVTGSIFNPSSSGPGVHLITYTFTDENGCEGYRVLYAEVLDCAGLSEESISGISLDPNPNDGNFVITGLDKGTDYKVYDYKGRLVISSTYTSGEEYVTIPEVNAGVYYLRATKDGKEGGIKFLIAK